MIVCYLFDWHKLIRHIASPFWKALIEQESFISACKFISLWGYEITIVTNFRCHCCFLSINVFPRRCFVCSSLLNVFIYKRFLPTQRFPERTSYMSDQLVPVKKITDDHDDPPKDLAHLFNRENAERTWSLLRAFSSPMNALLAAEDEPEIPWCYMIVTPNPDTTEGFSALSASPPGSKCVPLPLPQPTRAHGKYHGLENRSDGLSNSATVIQTPGAIGRTIRASGLIIRYVIVASRVLIIPLPDSKWIRQDGGGQNSSRRFSHITDFGSEVRESHATEYSKLLTPLALQAIRRNGLDSLTEGTIRETLSRAWRSCSLIFTLSTS